MKRRVLKQNWLKINFQGRILINVLGAQFHELYERKERENER